MLMKEFVSCLLISALAFISLLVYNYYNSYLLKYTCDLNNPSNRDFNVYYGIKYLKNPFSVLVGEENQNAPLYEPIIGESMKYHSMVLIGEKGAGKTQIRQYRLAQLRKEKALIIGIYGNQVINKYLQTFVNNVNIEENPIRLFSKKDFMHIILFEMVNEIYKFDFYDVVDNFVTLSLNERLDIAYLLAFYASDNINNLDIINELLSEKTKCLMCLKLHKTNDPSSSYRNLKYFKKVNVLSDERRSDSAIVLKLIEDKVGFPSLIFEEKSDIAWVSFIEKP